MGGDRQEVLAERDRLARLEVQDGVLDGLRGPVPELLRERALTGARRQPLGPGEQANRPQHAPVGAQRHLEQRAWV